MLEGTFRQGENAPAYRVRVLSEHGGKRGQLTVVRAGCTPLTHDSPLLDSDRDALQWTARHRDKLADMQASVTVDSAVVRDGDRFAVTLAAGNRPAVTLPQRFTSHDRAMDAATTATDRLEAWLTDQVAALMGGNLSNLLD